MSKKIPERSEIAVENTWRLEDLYGSDELWQADLVKFQQQIDALTGFAGKISQSAADLLAYMKLRDEISILADRLGNYAMRRGDQDTRNSHYQGMVGQFTTAYVEADEKTSFETPELLSIPEEKWRNSTVSSRSLRFTAATSTAFPQARPHSEPRAGKAPRGRRRDVALPERYFLYVLQCGSEVQTRP